MSAFPIPYNPSVTDEILGVQSRIQVLQERAEAFRVFDYPVSFNDTTLLKIIGVAAFVFSAASLLGVAVGAPFIASCVASILLFGAGYSILSYAARHIDLRDPEKVQLYREQTQSLLTDLRLQINSPEGDSFEVKRAATRILEQLKKRYGWQNMFYYGIPLPGVFNEILEFQAEHMSFSDLLKLHQEISGEYQLARQRFGYDLFSYDFPKMDAWTHKFEEEAREAAESPTNLCAFFEKFSLEQLLKSGVISTEKYRVLQHLKDNVERKKRVFDEQSQFYQRAYEREIYPHRQRMQRRIEMAEAEYENSPIHEEMRRNREDQVAEIRSLRLRRDAEREISEAREQLIRVKVSLMGNITDSVKDRTDLPPKTIEYILREEKRFTDAIERVNNRYEPFFEAIRHRYRHIEIINLPKFRDLKQRRRDAIEAAKEEFYHATNRSTEIFLALTAAPREAFYGQIDSELRLFRTLFSIR